MTERLYLRDAYVRSFTAVVESLEALDGRVSVILNKTAFFPESGGQPADQGTINGIPVVDVRQQGDLILHVLESESAPTISIGESVSCEINWELRYARMQAHTGEHIVSGIVHSLFGYDNVGFHMNDRLMVVDFSGSLSPEDIKTVERKANEAIYRNLDVASYYPTLEEIDTIAFRSKKELTKDLRIVTIGEDIDCCACCAPHVARTGEIGLIKILDSISYKRGTRMELVAGVNALLDYVDINQSIKVLMSITSVPRNKVVDAVRERYSSYQELRYEYQKLSQRLALRELELCELGPCVYAMAENISFDDLRYCANNLMEQGYEICLLCSKDDSEYLYVVSSKSRDIRPIALALNGAFDGKGGGKSEYSQGKLWNASKEEIVNIYKQFL